MKTRAFTLIELLVVLGIIGILAGLLYPAISKIRENGRQAQCANNLKELQTAVMTYASNSGRFPYATTYQAFDESLQLWYECLGWVGKRATVAINGSAGYVDMWDDGTAKGTLCTTNGTLWTYVLDKRVYLCPTFLIEAKKVQPSYTYVRNYVMNWNLNWQNVFSLTDASRKMLFTELNTQKTIEGKQVTTYTVFDNLSFIPNVTKSITYYAPQTTDGALMGTIVSPGIPHEGIATYHNGKGNAVFADGHIEALYYSNTWDVAKGNW